MDDQDWEEESSDEHSAEENDLNCCVDDGGLEPSMVVTHFVLQPTTV